jgi:hypothetical protein
MNVTLESERNGHSAQRSRLFWTLWSVAAAFGTYFCMYAFRKPFTAASYGGSAVWGLDFKVVLVMSQVAGYTVSKFIGMKVVAEMPPQRRAVSLLVLIGFAELALLLFGWLPRPWNAACLFLNGLLLGMVFGLVVGFLEGRQLTEALAAGLCTSFILGDGVTKSLGTWLLQRGVSEEWMPSLAGLMFLPGLLVAVAMLKRIPPPAVADVVERTERVTLSRTQRWSLVARYAFGLSLLVVMYLALTVLRSFRADFSPEIWRGLGEDIVPSTFSRSELVVAIGVLIVNGSAALIRDNRRAFFTALATCLAGFSLVGAALLGRQSGVLSGFAFMVLSGLGLYLPYVAMHTTVFERLLAMTRERGNLGFLINFADSIGYLGYVAVLLTKNLATPGDDVNRFFISTSWIVTATSLTCLAGTWCYFAARCPRRLPSEIAEVPA